jgi:hypothetical protein
MLAFLKRRWFLLSCAIVLLAGTMIDVCRWSLNTWYYQYGVQSGCLIYLSCNPWDLMDSAEPQKGSGMMVEVHRPKLGSFGFTDLSQSFGSLTVPIWLPLSVVIGWIVFREVKWREKRAISADAYGAH